MYTDEERKERKINIIKYVEEKFIKHIEHKSGYNRNVLKNVIKFCCDDAEIDFLMTMADAIEMNTNNRKYSVIPYENIIVVLLFVYYGLSILEPNTDYLHFDDMREILLTGNKFDKQMSEELYFDITSNEIDPEFNNNLGLSSEIRKHFFYHTGGTKKTKRKTKRKWSRKYKLSINCNRPKGFSQKQYCKYGRKNGRKKNSRRKK
jgi:hypothetical protein